MCLLLASCFLHYVFPFFGSSSRLIDQVKRCKISRGSRPYKYTYTYIYIYQSVCSIWLLHSVVCTIIVFFSFSFFFKFGPKFFFAAVNRNNTVILVEESSDRICSSFYLASRVGTNILDIYI